MKNFGRALARIAREMESMDLDDQREAARQVWKRYGSPLTEVERSSRYRDRRRHEKVTASVTMNGHEGVTDSPAPPESFPSLLDPKDLGTTGANGGPKIRPHRDAAKRLLAFLNEKTGKSFRPVDTHLVLIEARLKDGATEANCRGVIARKCAEWQDDPKTRAWLRPSTLFRASNFENYLGERPGAGAAALGSEAGLLVGAVGATPTSASHRTPHTTEGS